MAREDNAVATTSPQIFGTSPRRTNKNTLQIQHVPQKGTISVGDTSSNMLVFRGVNG